LAAAGITCSSKEVKMLVLKTTSPYTWVNSKYKGF